MTAFIYLNKAGQLNYYLVQSDITAINGELLDQEYGADNWLAIPESEVPSDFSVETYTIIDGQLVPAPAELIAERLAVEAKAAAEAEIEELRAYLVSTDYAAIKCGELGLAMVDTYPELHAQRTAARTRINELQEGGGDAGA